MRKSATYPATCWGSLLEDHVFNFSAIEELVLKLSCSVLLADGDFEFSRRNVDRELSEVRSIRLTTVLAHLFLRDRHNFIGIEFLFKFLFLQLRFLLLLLFIHEWVKRYRWQGL